MINGASLRDRATQASPRAPAGLGHPVSIPSAWTRLQRFAAGLLLIGPAVAIALWMGGY
jgi:hypothetical protein